MDRLTIPELVVSPTAARFMGEEVKIQDINYKLMHLILNGPTINSINKDTLRHLVRQLYVALQRYEDLEMTPEDIEHQLTNFSSFLMEMTGGRMSKTNYTVQAMVSEANDHFERVCDECSDRQELAEVKKELAEVKAELERSKKKADSLGEIAKLQADYQELVLSGKLTKKAMCDLVIPFRDRYGLTDLQALQIAREEMDLSDIVKVLEGCKE